MPQDYSLGALEQRLESHVQTFDTLLKLIPAKYYITDHSEDHKPSKFMHNKRKQAPKQAIKEATKKAKKAKLDPESHKSVAELQEEAAQRKKDESESESEAEEEDADIDEDDEEDGDMDMAEANFASLGNGIESDEDENMDEPEEKTSAADVSAPITPMLKTDISELKDRLHKRIADLRKNRNAPGSDASNPKSRESILQSRMKRKQDRKKSLQAKKEQRGNGDVNEEIIKESQPAANKSNQKFSASSIKDDGDVYFGRIETGLAKKKKGATDAKTQLKQVEAKHQKLEKLRQEDKDRAAALEEKETWNKALSMAQGEKVKDDIKLLKKTIKRDEHVKLKSSKTWNERKDKIKKEEADKQKKRNANIQTRIDAKKEKRLSKGKKTKARPGFEGKGGKGKKPTQKKGSKPSFNKKK
ncbi:hypothetical protein NQZ79_g4382 [Umbelopsis isabellina]|nr:hypothetical protein NQZ79_g4382 [Umbelopsis isabellina]